MADKKATLTLVLKDLASGAMRGVSSAMERLRENAVRIGAAFAALSGVIGLAVRAWASQEQAVVKLDNALKASGKSAAGASDRLVRMAQALQSVTTYEDDAIINTQALLATFGFTEQQIAKLTPRILDMAAATGTDLHAATLALGKAVATGNSGALSRYGVLLDENILKSKDFTSVVQALDAQFKGTAQAIGSTGTGSFIRLRNVLSDVAEEFGRLLTGYLAPFANAAIGLITRVTQMSESKKRLIAVLTLAATGFTGLLTAMSAVALALPALAAGLGLLFSPVTAIVAAIGTITLALGAFLSASDTTRRLVVKWFLELAETIGHIAAGMFAMMTGRFLDAAKEMKKAMDSAAQVTGESWNKAFSSMVQDVRDLKQELINEFTIPAPDIGQFPGVGETAPPPPATPPPATPPPTAPPPSSGGGVGGGSGGGSQQPPSEGGPAPIFGDIYDLFPPYDDPKKPPSPLQARPGYEWWWDPHAGIWYERPVGFPFPLMSHGSGGTGASIAAGGGAAAASRPQSGNAPGMKTEVHLHVGTLIADDRSMEDLARRLDRELYKLLRNGQTNAL